MIGTMTVNSVLSQGGLVVNQFGSMILLIVGIAFGVWAVRFVIARVKRARS